LRVDVVEGGGNDEGAGGAGCAAAVAAGDAVDAVDAASAGSVARGTKRLALAMRESSAS